ncbi:MAG TPA: efflux RND transporter periplasmic adaptor subunit [Chitinivibrionales bacterium]|nr:efflux RND transporter periplasmic adaptor subunit [Chitinivibrionales bacterium]
MKKNLTIILGLMLLACFFCSCKSRAPDPKAAAGANKFNATPLVEGFVVKSSVVVQSISISGTLMPFEETVLMPEVTGRVVAINLPEGKFVKQGTLLVKLFDDDLQASLRKSQTQLDLAKVTQKRQAELIKVNGLSQSDYDQAVLQVSSINADIEVLRAQIRKTEVRAPFDGIIGLRNISLGAEVTPQTALATIRDVARLKLDFAVPQKYGATLRPGMMVIFTLEGIDAKYEATVMATEEGVDEATRNLKARAMVKNTELLLKPGSFVNVELELGKEANALMVPTQAIIPQELGKQVILAKDGKAKFVSVKTGIRQASLIEVVSGIAEGDTIVTTGLLFLKPGADLKFSKISQHEGGR